MKYLLVTELNLFLHKSEKLIENDLNEAFHKIESQFPKFFLSKFYYCTENSSFCNKIMGYLSYLNFLKSATDLH